MGLDQISVRILKICMNEIADSLLENEIADSLLNLLINKSIETFTFPELWKIARVNPISLQIWVKNIRGELSTDLNPSNYFQNMLKTHSFEFNVVVATTSSFTERPVSIYKKSFLCDLKSSRCLRTTQPY
ncbi:Hypothetical predicted protein [Paramuricea clavata]|uniref:Uncharacterized protein n=1 Tax=Paramuricea clavata TaxID=317549 RepID=A0A6S7GLL9_PARCT|nr:Hypothetical predicted protein [Paramuricea clavata]